ncbi:hypothetical protein PSTT_14871 [Puccinia striiformis]|uniref:Hydrophobin n=1 Tax=Puccinia striiformis TaxID=27350 RepID=A0A2S4UKJ6_9BASI|nr:hypothetical protein PSTT_14871 [Puccinia striiformis]
MQLLALITLLLLTASMAVVARTKKECNLGSGITVLYLCFKPEDLTQNLHRVPGDEREKNFIGGKYQCGGHRYTSGYCCDAVKLGLEPGYKATTGAMPRPLRTSLENACQDFPKLQATST